MHKLITLFSLAFALSTSFALAVGGEKDFTTLFNSKDLEGWDSKPGAWEVRDGEI